MKRLILFISLVLLIGCDHGQSNKYDLVITNVNLIDGTGQPMQVGISVGIKDGRIVAIDNALKTISAENILSGKSKYLIPGLFDAHTHTTDFEEDFPRYIHYGITSIFITGGGLCTNEFYATLRERGSQDSIPAPIVFHTSQHFSMEGRHPSKTYKSSNWQDGKTIYYLKDTLQIEHLVREVSQYPISGIKLTIEDGPAPPFVERIPQSFIDKTVIEASKYGLEVFAHISDNTELEMAINGGVQNLVHFTGVNILPEDSLQQSLLDRFIDRKPFWITTLMLDKSFLYPLHPEWFESEFMLADYRQAVEVLTPELTERARIYVKILMDEYNLKENSLSAFMVPQVKDIQFLSDRGFTMVLGTDTGNDFIFPGYSLHEEMQLFEMGGMDPIDIIQMGTLNAARMLNAQDSLGSIEIGKIANLVLLDENPLEAIENTLAIRAVIKRGRIQERLINEARP